MSNEERKKVSELVTLYELEPTINDIYVEGVKDKSIIEYIIEESNLSDINVYNIDGIEIINRDKYANNNKGRVITLCEILGEELGATGDDLCYLCIVDSDRDRCLDKLIELEGLKYTGFTSLQMYALNEKTIKKFYRLSVGINYENITECIKSIIVDLFKFDMAKEHLGLNCGNVSITRLIEHKGDKFDFDFEKFIKRTLNSNQMSDKFDAVHNYLENIDLSSLSIFESSNYHDFIEVYSYYLIKKKGKDIFKPKVLESTISPSLELKHIREYDFIKELLEAYT